MCVHVIIFHVVFLWICEYQVRAKHYILKVCCNVLAILWFNKSILN